MFRKRGFFMMTLSCFWLADLELLVRGIPYIHSIASPEVLPTSAKCSSSEFRENLHFHIMLMYTGAMLES
jgi:hypothetical protein